MFENRYQAIAHYKNEQKKVDQDLQDWLVHFEQQKTEKVNTAMKELKRLQDLIDWNRDELKKEQKRQVEVSEW